MNEFDRQFYPENIEHLVLNLSEDEITKIANDFMGPKPEDYERYKTEKFNWDVTPGKVLFLYMKGNSEVKVANHLHVVRDTLANWKKKYPNFKELCDYGRELSQGFWEDANQRNAIFCLGNDRSIKYILQNRFRADHPKDNAGDKDKDKDLFKLLAEYMLDKKESEEDGGLSGLTKNNDIGEA